MDWGVILNYRKIQKRRFNPAQEDGMIYYIDVLLNLARNLDSKTDHLIPPKPNEKGEMKCVTISLNNITQISSARVFIPNDLKGYDNRQSVWRSITQVKNRLNKIPLLDPIEDMKITNNEFRNLIKRIEVCENKLQEFKKVDTKSLVVYEKKMEIVEKIRQVKGQLKKAQSLLQMDELKCRKRVLRRMGYCTAADVIETKGRVACEVTR